MHPRAYAERNANIHDRIKSAIAKLGGPDDLFDGITAKDPRVRALFERERIAEFLEGLAAKAPRGRGKRAAATEPETAAEPAGDPEQEA